MQITLGENLSKPNRKEPLTLVVSNYIYMTITSDGQHTSNPFIFLLSSNIYLD